MVTILMRWMNKCLNELAIFEESQTSSSGDVAKNVQHRQMWILHPQPWDDIEEFTNWSRSEKLGEKWGLLYLNIYLPRRLSWNPMIMISIYVSKSNSEMNNIRLWLYSTGHAHSTWCLVPEEIILHSPLCLWSRLVDITIGTFALFDAVMCSF